MRQWDAVAGTDRRLVEAVAQLAPVVWVDPPMSWFARRRRGVTTPRLSSPCPGVLRVNVVTLPGVGRPVIRSVSRRGVRMVVRRTLRSLHVRPDLVVSSSPEPLLRGWHAVPTVYYATDDFVAGAELLGFSRTHALRSLRANLRYADRVLAVSPLLAQTVAEACPGDERNAELLPNGCDPGMYERVDEQPVAADVTLPGPIAGFVGQINERIDVGLLEAVAARGISLLLVGPRYEQAPVLRSRIDALVDLPNVQWVGRQPLARLPGYLAAIDVGLTPYVDNAFNRASFPLKTLEYLAAGRPVVSVDLPSAHFLATNLVDVAHDAEQFVVLVEKRLSEERSPEAVAARRAFAAEHSWKNRAVDFLGRLSGATSRSVDRT